MQSPESDAATVQDSCRAGWVAAGLQVPVPCARALATRLAGLGLVAGSLAGCTSGPLSTLAPGGPVGASVAHIWWVMLTGAMVVLAVMMVIGVLVMTASPATRKRVRTRDWLVVGGLIVPGGVITALLAYGLSLGSGLLPGPSAAVTRVNIEARQWAWAASYPDLRWKGVGGETRRGRGSNADGMQSGPGTAGDSSLPPDADTATAAQAAQTPPQQTIIHIPAGVPVDFHLTSRDVIHSFWIPRLGGKMDAIPGRTNVLRLQADTPGIYRGLCAEFCGVGHALMPFEVHAHDTTEFESAMPRATQGAAP